MFSAVQLFVERSAGGSHALELTDADAPTVADICRRLDGIPLAIELAAAQVNVFGISALAAILDDRFRLLFRGRRTARQRHRTLGAMLDWSYEVLPESERLVLMRLGLFAGSFTLEAANFVVAHGDVNELTVVESIATLAEKSLVSADVSGMSVRYRLLDTTRAYAREKLADSGTFSLFARRHAEYHVSLFERAGAEYETSPASDWTDLYGRQIDDVRAALDWAFASDGDAALGMALTVAVVPLWVNLSLLHECGQRVERAIAWLQSDPDHDLLQDMRLHAALATARIITMGVMPDIHAAWAKVLEISQRLQNSKYRLQALQGLFVTAHIRSDYREGMRLAEEYHREATRVADTLALQQSDQMIGNMHHYRGDQAGARRLTVAYPAQLGDLAEGLGVAGQVSEGLTAVDEALQFCDRTGERWCMAELLRIKAELVLMTDRRDAVRAAETLLAESLDRARRQRALSWELRTSLSQARLLRRQGQPSEAHHLVAQLYERLYERFKEGFATKDLVAARILLDSPSTASVRHR